MTSEGPHLEALTRRLAETPADILAEPRFGNQGLISVDAVVADVLSALAGRPLTKAEAEAVVWVYRAQTSAAKTRRRHFRLALVAAWLLADPWFQGRNLAEGARQFLLGEELKALAESVEVTKLVADPDRREELARLGLSALGLRPSGENEAQAQDRLTTLSSVERERVIRAARQAEERARQIREEMARKAAEEAADKWNRE